MDLSDPGEFHVSAYKYEDSPSRTVPAVMLPELLERHGLGAVDLLKIDCEGGEYDILPTTPIATFERIRNVVFEFHRLAGFEDRLERVTTHLRESGFAIERGANIVFARRAPVAP